MLFIFGLMYLQMIGALMPVIFFSSETWDHPFVPILWVQHIFKYFVLISVGVVLGATIYGGRIVATLSEAIHITHEQK